MRKLSFSRQSKKSPRFPAFRENDSIGAISRNRNRKRDFLNWYTIILRITRERHQRNFNMNRRRPACRRCRGKFPYSIWTPGLADWLPGRHLKCMRYVNNFCDADSCCEGDGSKPCAQCKTSNIECDLATSNIRFQSQRPRSKPELAFSPNQEWVGTAGKGKLPYTVPA